MNARKSTITPRPYGDLGTPTEDTFSKPIMITEPAKNIGEPVLITIINSDGTYTDKTIPINGSLPMNKPFMFTTKVDFQFQPSSGALFETINYTQALEVIGEELNTLNVSVNGYIEHSGFSIAPAGSANGGNNFTNGLSAFPTHTGLGIEDQSQVTYVSGDGTLEDLIYNTATKGYMEASTLPYRLSLRIGPNKQDFFSFQIPFYDMGKRTVQEYPILVNDVIAALNGNLSEIPPETEIKIHHEDNGLLILSEISDDDLSMRVTTRSLKLEFVENITEDSTLQILEEVLERDIGSARIHTYIDAEPSNSVIMIYMYEDGADEKMISALYVMGNRIVYSDFENSDEDGYLNPRAPETQALTEYLGDLVGGYFKFGQ